MVKKTTPVEWVDALLYLFKRIIIIVTAVASALAGVLLLLVASDVPLNDGFVPAALGGSACLVLSWYLFEWEEEGLTEKI
jgi:hypothetical protein